MTKPTPPASRTGDNRFARDVAKQLDRRRMRRKLVRWTAVLAMIAAAALYLRWGQGFGLGGGLGLGGPNEPQPAAALRCAIRVARTGITIDGKPRSRDEAVAACKETTGADVIITGDAREGDWKDLRSALEAAGLKDIAVHEPAPVGSASK